MSSILKMFNLENEIKKQMPNIIETFVSFYGEENRSHIEKMLNDVIIIGYQTPLDEKMLIDSAINEKTNELINQAYKDSGLDINEEKLSFLCGPYYPNYDKFPILKIRKFVDDYKLGMLKRKNRDIKNGFKLLRKYAPELKFSDYYMGNIPLEHKALLPDEYKDHPARFFSRESEKNYIELKSEVSYILNLLGYFVTCDDLEEFYESGNLDKLLKFCDEITKNKKVFDKFYDDNLKGKSLSNKALLERGKKIEDLCYKKYLRKVSFVLNEDDRDIKNYSNIKGRGIVVHKKLRGAFSLEYFLKDKEDELKNEILGVYVKLERINYFKYRGIDLGNNYDDYVNNEECKKIWPSDELIKSIIGSNNAMYLKYCINYYENLPLMLEKKKEADDKGLLLKNKYLSYVYYVLKITCVSPNVIYKDNNYHLYPQIMFYLSNNENMDGVIIHELNHLYELSIKEINDNSITYKCGWEEVHSKIINRNSENNKQSRKYESFNEATNEMLTRLITNKMHKENHYIINDPNKSKKEEYGYYDSRLIFLKDFYDEYLPEIIKSRNGNNMEILYDRVGKENFEELNELVNSFAQDFNKVYIKNIFKEKKNMELYYAYEKRRDEILNNMKKWNNKKVLEKNNNF